MRKTALAFMVLGLLAAGTGIALRFVAWSGQQQAAVRWEEQPEKAVVSRSPVLSKAAVAKSHKTRSSKASLSKLHFLSQDETFYVHDGATDRNLLLGPAWVEGSVHPGENGNCIIAGHRDTHFGVLRTVHNGDEIAVERGGQTFRYRVTEIRIVSAAEDKFYRPTEQPALTLVTCYPFWYVGNAPKRFIVRAELVQSS
jgi:LPXTG-site transpeptidase (sortase) family protein